MTAVSVAWTLAVIASVASAEQAVDKIDAERIRNDIQTLEKDLDALTLHPNFLEEEPHDVVIISGLMSAGKTYLCSKLAEAYGNRVVTHDTDHDPPGWRGNTDGTSQATSIASTVKGSAAWVVHIYCGATLKYAKEEGREQALDLFGLDAVAGDEEIRLNKFFLIPTSDIDEEIQVDSSDQLTDDQTYSAYKRLLSNLLSRMVEGEVKETRKRWTVGHFREWYDRIMGSQALGSGLEDAVDQHVKAGYTAASYAKIEAALAGLIGAGRTQ